MYIVSSQKTYKLINFYTMDECLPPFGQQEK